MKAPMFFKKRYKLLLQLCWLISVLLTSSCLPATIFSVQFPQTGKTYIGNELVDFVIKYSKPVTQSDVYLNGVAIGKEFNYGPTKATANILNLKKYVKQGVNTLTVDPLAFGPTVTFVVDNAGPDILVTWGKNNSGAGTVDIGGELRDASDISSLKLNIVRVTGVNQETGLVQRSIDPTITIPVDANAKFFKTGIDNSAGVTIYSFTATDIHGQVSTKEYLADSDEAPVMAISNAMRMAIGDSFIESLRPVVAAGLYTALQAAPIDVRDQCWNDPNKTGDVSQNPNGGFCSAGQDGSTFNAGLNPVYANILGIAMDIIVERINMTPGNSTVLLNGFKIRENNNIKIDMVITEMLVALNIKGTLLFIPLEIDMTMTIGRTVVDTGADVSAVNKKFNVQLTDSNFSLQNISVSETKLWGVIEIGFIVDLIMPLLEGVIADLLPGILNPILNDNLQKIVIGACMYPKDDITLVACNAPTSSALFNWAVNVETIKTDNLFGPGNPYDMVVGLETQFNLLKQDAFARPSLGPVYVEDPVDIGLIFNSLGETGTNLSLAISSNALNQAFSALYQSGFTHLTFYNGAISYGANPSLPVGTNGQTRIRLYPESPPFFTLNPVGGGVGGAAAARVGYEAAYLYFDLNENGVWKNQLKLGVNFDIAATIEQVDQAVRLGIDGSPIFNLNTMVNNTGLPVTQGMLQTLLDAVTIYFIPTITDQFVIVDLAQFTDSSINGTVVLFQDDKDDRTQTLTAGGCPLATNTAGGDGKYDYVCQTINFEVNTNTLTSTGNKGTNLFFQMEARDPQIPAAAAAPRMDLDGDGVLDYKDNCAAPILMQIAAIKLEGGLVPANIDSNGNPVGNFEDRVKAHINRWINKDLGIPAGPGVTYGNYLPTATPVAGSGTPLVPTSTEIAWWNQMRKGDTAITSLGTNPWVKMLYSNANQMNTDGDRRGELCEDDTDRDGIYVDNGIPRDKCPSVKDPSNNPGSCTIDDAEYVLFKNKFNGLCLSHGQFSGATNSGGVVNFSPGASSDGTLLGWKACNTNDLGQRFWVEVSPSDESHVDRGFCSGALGTCKERVIYIYSNEYKQTEPGFYDIVNHHYMATTVANIQPTKNSCPSSYWANDDVIMTTMCGYDEGWREWVLSLSNISDTSYPYLIESWQTYQELAGARYCIFQKAGNANVDQDNGSCYPSDAVNRERAAFQVLLGPQQVKWTGLFRGD
jgi:hypothetical protein